MPEKVMEQVMALLPDNYAALILAAGKGTRMHSPKPKVLQTLLGEPMLYYSLAAVEPLFGGNIFIVAGHKAEDLARAFPDRRFILQTEQLGTGHALMTAMPALEKNGIKRLLVINGDTPLISSEILAEFIGRAKGADLAFAGIRLENPGAYGRIVRKDGKLEAIVEAKDYNALLHGPDSGEVNAGIYFLDLGAIAPLLPEIGNDNGSREYYITDLVALALAKGLNVAAIQCGEDENLLGVNSPPELSRMEEILRQRQAARLLEKGVVIHGPAMLSASPRASIEPGVEICCPCEITGESVIHAGAVIESHCVIHASEVLPNAHLRSFSHLDHAQVGPSAQAGPYTRLRPGAKLEEGAHAGNFVELKKATLGKGAKANHLAYLGDAEIGPETNIGAGTITCNYDGKNKFRTEIGAHAFIGSNSALVAPVKIGDNALVGAGSVITHDVPEDEMAIARSRQKNMRRRKK